MRPKPRIIRATLIAPLAVGPAVFVALPLYYLPLLAETLRIDEIGDLVAEWLMVTSFLTVYGGVIAFVAILVVGLPVYAILRRFELATPLPCALLASVIGLVGGEFADPEPAFFGLMGICAAAVAAAFCRLANGPEESA